MTTEQANPGQAAAAVAPPVARRVPQPRTHHGDTVPDDYAWLADKENPDVIAYLTAENEYADAMMAGQAAERETIFNEIKGRTQETDLSVPTHHGGWWYYSRTQEGRQYAVYCRCPARPDDLTPPQASGGEPLPGEQILLDCNEVAGDSPFFSLGAFEVSPDGRLLAYSVDEAGDERFTLRVKDLTTGQLAADEISDTHYGCAWSKDGTALFYVTPDAAWRPYRVWRHMLGTPASDDVTVMSEPDERFRVRVELTRSEEFIQITLGSALSSEVWLLDAGRPTAGPRLVMGRRPDVDYSVEHQVLVGGTSRLLILHNDGALNFTLACAPLPEDIGEGSEPLTGPADMVTLIAHRPDTRLLRADAFAEQVVVYFRRDALTGLRILPNGGGEFELTFPEPVYQVSPGRTPDYHSRSYRLRYASLATPDSVYDADCVTGELMLRKQRPVLTLPGRDTYDPAGYEQHREWATAPDGTQVPISLVCRKGTARDGRAPLLLYGYGSYEISIDPSFSIARLSLLDRGFVFAIAHVRGGGEMGRQWYEEGRTLHKTNTFTDFIACARHLVAQGWTTPRRLIARGASAGGLLMGVVANLAPDAFGGILAQVPFTDALTTILDPSMPLTVTEWDEWGDPLHDPQVYAYMKAYTPYENTRPREYPPILALTSLNDTRVLYHEPAKWIAKLRVTGHGGPFLLKTEMIAGHGGRSGRYDAWREEAMIIAWIDATARRDAD